jgi:hypothetical protein
VEPAQPRKWHCYRSEKKKKVYSAGKTLGSEQASHVAMHKNIVVRRSLLLYFKQVLLDLRNLPHEVDIAGTA